MAIIGLRYAVASPIMTEKHGERPTYGTGFIVGKMLKADITTENNATYLYADDATAESDTSLKSISITLGVDDLSYDVQKNLLGNDVTDELLTKGSDDVAPYHGFGCIVVHKKNNERIYEATLYFKTQFSEPSSSSETKGESIAFQTPELSGVGMPIAGYKNGAWVEKKKFKTEDEAMTWLNTELNVSEATVATMKEEETVTANEEEEENETW